MSIYISNALYLTSGIGPDFNENNPIIGYDSILLPEYFSASGFSGRPPSNVWSPDTFSSWQGQLYQGPSQTTTQYFNIENPVGVSVNYIGIAKHNFGTGNYTYSIEESNDNSTWADLVAPKIVPTDKAIMEYFDTTNSLYFRIKLERTATEFQRPIISHIKMGTALVLQRRIYVGHTPAAIASSIKRQVLNSENGQYIGQIVKSKFHTTSCDQENVTPAFVRDKIVPFINHVNGEVEIEGTAPSTFFFAWRPSDYPDEVVYGWTNENIQPENQGNDGLGGRMRFSFKIEAVA